MSNPRALPVVQQRVLRKDLYYYCQLGKQPNMGKIRNCCAAKNCPHMQTRKRKNRS